MRFSETQASRSARLEGCGGHRSQVYPRSAVNGRKSGKPDLFETPRTRLRNQCRPKIAAPHHEGREEPRVRQIDQERSIMPWLAPVTLRSERVNLEPLDQ